MPIALPQNDYIKPINQDLVTLIQSIVDNAPGRDKDIHAVIVLRRKAGNAGEPVLYVDVNQVGCTEIVLGGPSGYPVIEPVAVQRLDYASSLSYDGVQVAGVQAVPNSCWYVVNGRRYHCKP